ncbi:siderophore-interacting protein [Flavobacterium sp.]|uniref:siderophore-interacting protein n=1 Tax=Flavobacterium sp. TaxID=239 RepID=UPI003751F358
MELLKSIISKAFNTALVIQKKRIATNTFQIKLKLNSNSFKNYIAGEQLKIFVGIDDKSAFSDLTRTYSVWNFDKEKQEIDLAICTFSNGQGTKWIKEIEVGKTVHFASPKGKFIIDNTAQNYLFLGDISALSHLYELNRQLSTSQNAIGIIYAKNENDFFKDQFSDSKFEFIVSQENHTKRIIEEIEKLNLKKENSIVYIAGETFFCTDLNSYFRKTLKWESKQIKTKPFWHPNKTGLE